MSIPLATTTITIERRAAGDLRDQGDYETVATGIRAHIGDPVGAEAVSMGSSERLDKRLGADPCDLHHDDRVTDDTTDDTYDVSWVTQRRGLGLDHTAAGLVRVTDRVST